MRILDRDDKIYDSTSISIGKFDGLHKGHQKLIQESFRDDMCSLVIKINTNANKNLLSDGECADAVSMLGVDYYVKLNLDDVRMMSPEEFIKRLVNQYNAGCINVGHDFRFGNNATGNIGVLEQLSKEYGFSLNVVSDYMYEGIKVSSSRIRSELQKGNIKKVNEMLGYNYVITGKVRYGNEIGRTIDFPTANIVSEKYLPRRGVYFTETNVNGQKYYGITNVGIRPTVNTDDSIGENIETNIFDFNENIYDEMISVTFLDYLREEKKFDDIDSLKIQITKDRESALKLIDSVYKNI